MRTLRSSILVPSLRTSVYGDFTQIGSFVMCSGQFLASLLIGSLPLLLTGRGETTTALEKGHRHLYHSRRNVKMFRWNFHEHSA
ncbi:hypothetical protein NDU88_006881 [Pleurodeles waltl]|uniref:Uncharacterized protein n=1 Tax=Pleurodeles waltl TaxID=8319 RepID=A0AAV7QN19_PLEWA|nr:hypothetical protein NDU88_006881 [Pleurodeles waltl]